MEWISTKEAQPEMGEWVLILGRREDDPTKYWDRPVYANRTERGYEVDIEEVSCPCDGEIMWRVYEEKDVELWTKITMPKGEI